MSLGVCLGQHLLGGLNHFPFICDWNRINPDWAMTSDSRPVNVGSGGGPWPGCGNDTPALGLVFQSFGMRKEQEQ
jgi:hypothetical protein